VVPSHALKFAATLQAADAGEQPILLRVDTQAGHGLGKPIAKLIDEQTDIYAFLFQIFSMNPANS
jgi:prolyl oligopeptidase